MKKTLLTIGIVLLVLAMICLLAGLFYHWAVFSVMDGSQNLYDRLFRMRRIFLFSGIGFFLSGVVFLAISHVLEAD